MQPPSPQDTTPQPTPAGQPHAHSQALHRLCISLQPPALEHLESHCVFMPPLHVVDVPGHAGHGVNGILHYLEAVLFFIKMFGNFLRGRQGLSPDSKALPRPQPTMYSGDPWVTWSSR